MKIQKVLRLSVVRPIPAGVDTGSPVRVIEHPTAYFCLEFFEDPHGGDYGTRFAVYEHLGTTRCPSCGCPPFRIDVEELPQEIIEHLETHLQVCSEFWPEEKSETRKE